VGEVGGKYGREEVGGRREGKEREREGGGGRGRKGREGRMKHGYWCQLFKQKETLQRISQF